ncbi:MAG: VWA domain-containing protein [Planctomycetes bacterium]|nr:VWA domain-containing protein [Planctomycetota bacterium]
MNKNAPKYFIIGLFFAALIIGFLNAQDGDSEKIIRSSDITIFGLDLNGITDDIVRTAGVYKPASKEKDGYVAKDPKDTPLIAWLVDNTSYMKTSKCPDLLSAAIAKSFDKCKGYQMSVIKYAKKAVMVCDPTDNIKNVASGINSVFQSVDDGYKDSCAAIRESVELLKKYPNNKKHLVIFTVQNNDLESNLEDTLVLLNENKIKLLVIGGGTILCDPNKDPYGEVPEGSKVYRADSAEIELSFINPHLEWWYPKGNDKKLSSGDEYYLHNYPYYNTYVFSGYGVYGLSRLAAYSGGKYYMFSPPGSGAPGATFCEMHYCKFCDSKNKKNHSGDNGCVAPFDKFLPVFAPLLISREDFNYKYSRDPVYSLLQKICAKSGAWLAIDKSIFDDDGTISSGYLMMADKELERVNEFIKDMEETLAEKAKDSPKRFVAHAEAVLANLYIERFGLNQQRNFIMKLKPKDLEPTGGNTNCYSTVIFECLCHIEELAGITYDKNNKDGYVDAKGSLPDKIMGAVKLMAQKDRITIYGGKEGEDELAKTLNVVIRTIGRYKNTPWELIVRRLPVLARIRIDFSAVGGGMGVPGVTPPPSSGKKPTPSQTPGTGPRGSQTGK